MYIYAAVKAGTSQASYVYIYCSPFSGKGPRAQEGKRPKQKRARQAWLVHQAVSEEGLAVFGKFMKGLRTRNII